MRINFFKAFQRRNFIYNKKLYLRKKKKICYFLLLVILGLWYIVKRVQRTKKTQNFNLLLAIIKMEFHKHSSVTQ